MVVADEGVLQRCPGAFHFGGGAAEHGHTPFVGKLRQCAPGGAGSLGAVVNAAQAVLADAACVHAGYGGVIQLEPGGDHQKVVGNGFAVGGDHFAGFGVDFSGGSLHPFHVLGQIVGGGRDRIVAGFDACRHQREAGLVEMLFAGIDQRDFGPLQPGCQTVGSRQTCRSPADDDDVGLAVHGCLCLGSGAGCQCGDRTRRRCQRQGGQKATALGGIHGGRCRALARVAKMGHGGLR